jgi:hypothetical protein
MVDILIRDRRHGSRDQDHERRWQDLMALTDCGTRCWRLGYDLCSACFSPGLIELALPIERYLLSRVDTGAAREVLELARALALEQARPVAPGSSSTQCDALGVALLHPSLCAGAPSK